MYNTSALAVSGMVNQLVSMFHVWRQHLY